MQGVQTYRLAISPSGAGFFRLKIEAINMMSNNLDPNPILADGIGKQHYEQIMNPLTAAFTEKGWLVAV